MTERSNRKVRTGVVISDASDKTVTVEITDVMRHAKYGKTIRRRKRLYAHDEENDARLGDRVRVMETRPVSKSKRWRVVEVLERAR
jgi:small subunit ribosomal protein S17